MVGLGSLECFICQAVGYTEDDVPALVEQTLPQHRVTKLSPVPAGEDELRDLFQQSMSIW